MLGIKEAKNAEQEAEEKQEALEEQQKAEATQEEIDELRHSATASLIDYKDVIVVASVSANDCATAIVPFARIGFSNTPIGPFHTTVFADLTASA